MERHVKWYVIYRVADPSQPLAQGLLAQRDLAPDECRCRPAPPALSEEQRWSTPGWLARPHSGRTCSVACSSTRRARAAARARTRSPRGCVSTLPSAARRCCGSASSRRAFSSSRAATSCRSSDCARAARRSRSPSSTRARAHRALARRRIDLSPRARFGLIFGSVAGERPPPPLPIAPL